MSKMLCISCTTRLEDAFLLRKQAQQNDTYMRRNFNLAEIKYSDVKIQISKCNQNKSYCQSFNTQESDMKDTDHNSTEPCDSPTDFSLTDSEADVSDILTTCDSNIISKHSTSPLRDTYKEVNEENKNITEKQKRTKTTKNLAKSKTNILNKQKIIGVIDMRSKNYNIGVLNNDVKPVNEISVDKCINVNNSPNLVSHSDNSVEFPKKPEFKDKDKILGNKSESKKGHQCSICADVFNHKHSFTKHMKTKHRLNGFERTKHHMCDVCGNTFHDQYGLSMHKRSHSGDKPFTCNICGQGFSQQSNMERHISAKHRKDKPFQCELCPKRFAYSSTLREHVKKHSGEKSHACEACGRRFSRRYALLRHQLTHTRARPFVCIHCKKSYTQTNDLKAHVKRSHEGAPTEKFTDYCLKEVKV